MSPMRLRTAYSPPTPSRLIATTNKPDTAPPRMAIWRARFNELLAADAVLMLDLIETNIPMYPAIPDDNAPKMNETVTYTAICSGATGSAGLCALKNPYRRKMIAAKTTLSIVMVLYCLRRKASAPSLIALEMTCISAVPVSFLSTFVVSHTANASDKTLIIRTVANSIDLWSLLRQKDRFSVYFPRDDAACSRGPAEGPLMTANHP